MIVKKLRARKNWSQEQLAEFTGLSTRTIQRIESGRQASLESLKSLAAVFEVEISKLTEEITVIDRQTEQWKALPYWKRANIWGIRSRSQLLRIEYIVAIGGVLFFIASLFATNFSITEIVSTKLAKISAAFLFAAYLQALTIRDFDKRDIW